MRLTTAYMYAACAWGFYASLRGGIWGWFCAAWFMAWAIISAIRAVNSGTQRGIVKTNLPGALTGLDAMADEKDDVQIEILNTVGGKTVYVHVNGQTVARIGKIKKPIDVTMPLSMIPELKPS